MVSVSAALAALALLWPAGAARAAGPSDAEAERLTRPLLVYARDLAAGDAQARVRLIDVEMAQSIVLNVTVESVPEEGVYRIHHLLARSWTVPVEAELSAEPAITRAVARESRALPKGPALEGEAADRFLEVAAALAAGVEAASAAGRPREAAGRAPSPTGATSASRPRAWSGGLRSARAPAPRA